MFKELEELPVRAQSNLARLLGELLASQSVFASVFKAGPRAGMRPRLMPDEAGAL